jgi:hypothetical protein
MRSSTRRRNDQEQSGPFDAAQFACGILRQRLLGTVAIFSAEAMTIAAITTGMPA